MERGSTTKGQRQEKTEERGKQLDNNTDLRVSPRSTPGPIPGETHLRDLAWWHVIGGAVSVTPGLFY